MLWRVGEYEVERLVRVRFGPVKVEGIPPREWRFLTMKEVAKLRDAAPVQARPPACKKA